MRPIPERGRAGIVDEFLADMAALQHQLFLEVAGHHGIAAPHREPLVLQSYLLLQVWDRLSLQFALRQAADGMIGPVPMGVDERTQIQCQHAGDFALTLDPYPFADDRVHFPILAARVPHRRYRDPEEFVAALTAAATLTIDCVAMRS